MITTQECDPTQAGLFAKPSRCKLWLPVSPPQRLNAPLNLAGLRRPAMRASARKAMQPSRNEAIKRVDVHEEVVFIAQ